jgi:glutamate---cysteine ligase / carboxylate-amine ligase
MMRNQSKQQKSACQALQIMLDQGPLSRRILRAVGPEYSKQRLGEVYGKLCECLETGNMFLGMD